MNTSRSYDDKSGQTQQSSSLIQTAPQRQETVHIAPSNSMNLEISHASGEKETSENKGSIAVVESCNAANIPSQNSTPITNLKILGPSTFSQDLNIDQLKMPIAGDTVGKPKMQRPAPQSVIKQTETSTVIRTSISNLKPSPVDNKILKIKGGAHKPEKTPQTPTNNSSIGERPHMLSSPLTTTIPQTKLNTKHMPSIVSSTSNSKSDDNRSSSLNPLYVSGVFYSPVPMNSQINKTSTPYMYPTASKGLIMNPAFQRSDNIRAEIDQKQTQLMEAYSPYIVPNDESIVAARARLRKAMDQTRQLRAAFTDRVYNKYRIILRPVPKNVDDIIHSITADPLASKLKLDNQIKTLKEEKEIEKREAFQRAASAAAANAGVGEAGETMDMNVTNSDDHYFGAGLNIVILPEEDIDEDDPILRQYEHRGPTDPDTGQRLGGISSAAATAAETVLERARRGASLRMERTRLTPFDKVAGNISYTAGLEKSSFEKKKISLTNDTSVKPLILDPQRRLKVSGSDLLSLQSHNSIGIDNKYESRGSKSLHKTQGVAGTASTSSLLVISPRAETPGSASTAALVIAGVGVSTSSKSQQQNLRRRHPFSKSKAGLALSSTYSSSTKKSSLGSLPIMRQSNTIKTELLLPNNMEIRRKKIISNYIDVTEEYAPSRVQSLELLASVLKYFRNDEQSMAVDNASIPLNVIISESIKEMKPSEKIDVNQLSPSGCIPKVDDKVATESREKSISQLAQSCKNKSQTLTNRKRKVTEIGLHRGLRFHNNMACDNVQSGKVQSISLSLPTTTVQHSTEHVKDETTRCYSTTQNQLRTSQNENSKNSTLAYSVLFALGIFGGRADFQRHFKACSTMPHSDDNQYTQSSTVLHSVKLLKDETLKLKDQSVSDSILNNWKSISNLMKSDEKNLTSLSGPQGATTGKRMREEDAGVNKTEEKNAKIVKLVIPTHENPVHKVVEDVDEKKITSCAQNISEPFGNEVVLNNPGKVILLTTTSNDSSNNKNQKMRNLDAVSKQEKSSAKSHSEPSSSIDLIANNSLFTSISKTPLRTVTQINVKTSNRQATTLSSIAGITKEATLNTSNNTIETPLAALPPMVSQYNHQSPSGWNPLIGRYVPNQPLLQNQGQLYHQLNAGMDQGFAVLPQSTSANPYSSALAHNGVGLNTTQQHLNHPHVPLLNTNSERFSIPSSHMIPPSNTRPPIIYPETLGHMPPSSVNSQDYIDYYNSSGINRPPNPPAFIVPSDWPSLSTPGSALLSQASASMMGLNLTPTQARTMMMHLHEQSRAMMAREQQHAVATAQAIQAAAARNNINNLSTFSAHAGNSFSQPILSHHNSLGVINQGDTLKSRQRVHKSEVQLAAQNSAQQVTNITSVVPKIANDASGLINVAALSSTKSNVRAKGNLILKQQQIPTIQPITNIPVHNEKKRKSTETPENAHLTEPSLTGNYMTSSLTPTLPPKSLVTDFNSNVVLTTGETCSTGANKVLPQASRSSSSVCTILGLRFFSPKIPSGLSLESAELILQGRIHDVEADKQLALNYLIDVGTAVPIPKALVQNPLKERIGSLCKDIDFISLSAPKDVVVAAITGWLWAEHKDCFQAAFAKSGRIDVDPECKWLIHTTVEVSVRAMQTKIDIKRSGKIEELGDFGMACLVCKSLMREICIDDEMDVSSMNFQELTKLLDIRREMALKYLCQERVLLANLLSRHVNISEFFSNAYVSSLVRAGEALGHEDLCELVHDEECLSSSLLPYDIIVDVSGAWEEPCQPDGGFTLKLTVDELSKRAHARARIQKSLFKLQEKFGIKGGVRNAGSYVDAGATSTDAVSSSPPSLQSPLSRSTSAGIKRRSSSGSVQNADLSYSPGLTSGMAQVFNPAHYSVPLQWDLDDSHNKPYGIHGVQGKKGKRSGYLSKKARHGHSSPSSSNKIDNKEGHLRKPTAPIDWLQVAKRFHSVTNVEPPSQAVCKEKTDSTALIIIAPIVHELNDDVHLNCGSDSESDLEEDITDEAVLARHQKVLDDMKHKLELAIEATPRRR